MSLFLQTVVFCCQYMFNLIITAHSLSFILLILISKLIHPRSKSCYFFFGQIVVFPNSIYFKLFIFTFFWLFLIWIILQFQRLQKKVYPFCFLIIVRVCVLGVNYIIMNMSTKAYRRICIFSIFVCVSLFIFDFRQIFFIEQHSIVFFIHSTVIKVIIENKTIIINIILNENLICTIFINFFCFILIYSFYCFCFCFWFCLISIYFWFLHLIIIMNSDSF